MAYKHCWTHSCVNSFFYYTITVNEEPQNTTWLVPLFPLPLHRINSRTDWLAHCPKPCVLLLCEREQSASRTVRDGVKAVGLTALWTPALVVVVFFSFVVLQLHTEAWLFLAWSDVGEEKMSSGPLEHLRLGLCHMLLLFCACSFILLAIFEKNGPEIQFKQWYSGCPLQGSFGNSLV